METSKLNIHSATASRTLEEAQAMAEASGVPAPQSQRNIEASQAALQKRIDQFRHAEVKREFAPVSLAGIVAAISAVLAFTSQKERELLDVIRNLRGDHRLGIKGVSELDPAILKLDNERLKQLSSLYDEHERHYNLLRHGMSEQEMAALIRDESKKVPDPLRENLGAWLQREYAEMKKLDNVSVNEVLDKKFTRYKNETFKVFKQVNADIKKYAEKHGIDFTDEMTAFTGDQEKFVKITNYAQLEEQHMGKIANMYERAYIKITSARQEFRTAIDREVLLKIRQMGKSMGFRDLTQAAKVRSFMFAGVVSVAASACIYALIKFITKESPEERQERQQLQATKEWEMAQAKVEHHAFPIEKELGMELRGSHIQALAQREPQSHTERLANASTTGAVLGR